MAAGLSAGFLGLTMLTSPVVAAVVVLPVSIAVGAIRAHNVPRATPHTLREPSFEPVADVDAPKVAPEGGSETGTPAA